MIRSMTGFGASSGVFAERALSVEIKSVNNRFREITIRAPKIFAPLEDQIKKLLSARLERGRVDVWLQIDEKDLKRQNLKADLAMAQNVKRALEDICNALGFEEKPSLGQILSYNVLRAEDEAPDMEALWAALAPAVEEAISALIYMREREGEALLADLEKRLDKLADFNRLMEALVAEAPRLHLEKLRARLEELCAGLAVDPARLAQEAALLADRADVTEEVVRFKSHLDRFREILADDEAAGRRLDFLLQEMGREVNTMGSKSQDMSGTNMVLDMKAELEKLREQVQNVE